MPSPPEDTPAPLVRVLAGKPSPEQVAALVAVLAAAGSGGAGPIRGPVREWANPARAVRAPVRAGRGAWSHSAWPL